MIRSACRLRAAFSLLALAFGAAAVTNGAARAETTAVPAYRMLQAAEPMTPPGSAGSDFSANAPSLVRTDTAGNDTRAVVAAPWVSDSGAMHCRACRSARERIGWFKPDRDHSRRRSGQWWARRHARHGGHPAYRENRHLFERSQLSDGGEGMVMARSQISLLAVLAVIASPLSSIAEVYPPFYGSGGGSGGVPLREAFPAIFRPTAEAAALAH